MAELFRIEAGIKINIEKGRSWPIKTGYRPGFIFVENQQTSGAINLLNKDYLNPGEECVVEINFISNELLGDVKAGTLFEFYEGSVEIGSGRVLKVIGWISSGK